MPKGTLEVRAVKVSTFRPTDTPTMSLKSSMGSVTPVPSSGRTSIASAPGQLTHQPNGDAEENDSIVADSVPTNGDVTQCSLERDDELRPTICRYCRRTFIDPRILPCLHTFCLACLQLIYEQSSGGAAGGNRNVTTSSSKNTNIAKNHHRQNQNQLRCPSCGETAVLPVMGGVAALRRDHFTVTTIEKENLMRHVVVADDADGDEGERKPKLQLPCGFSARCAGGKNPPSPAAVYCTVCRAGLCDRCVTAHRVAGSGSHRLVDVEEGGDGTLEADTLNKMIVSYCEQHGTEELNVYCRKCQAVCCTRCFIARHNGHPYSSVGDMAETFSRQMQRELDSAGGLIQFDRRQLELLRVERKKLADNADRIELEITQRADEIKRRVDYETRQLIELLTEYKVGELEKFENSRLEIERCLGVKKRFADYVSAVKDDGSPVELARLAGDIQTTHGASGLMHSAAGKRTVQTASISYRASSLTKKNLIGQLKLAENTRVIRS